MDDRVKIIGTKTLAHEWGHLRQTTLELRRRDGTWQRQVRESYNRGNAAATLLYNPQERTVC